MSKQQTRRAFANVPHGQIHYRHSGSGDPLVLLHASPGSSRQLIGLAHDLASGYQIISPDTPGNGDSDALGEGELSIGDLAAAFVTFLDEIGLEKVSLYGSHTGASIAVDIAIQAPDRVDKLILDGLSTFEPDELAEVLELYAHPFTPDLDGAYLMRAFHFCRDQWSFFPWYRRTRAGRRDSGLPSPADLHGLLVEVLKANETYHRNYRAAFRWNGFEKMPLVSCPTLVIAGENDPLFDISETLTPHLSNGRFVGLPRFDDPDYREQRAALIKSFLSSSDRA